MGEYLVGAYLKMVLNCDVVDFGVRFPGGHLRGLQEIDVMGFKFADRSVYMCEAVTHLTGACYGDYPRTVEKVKAKMAFHKAYARDRLDSFPVRHSMLWAPWVASGLRAKLAQIGGLELVVNEDYAQRVDLLLELAGNRVEDTGNPAFRVLQILKHVRRRHNGCDGPQHAGSPA